MPSLQVLSFCTYSGARPIPNSGFEPHFVCYEASIVEMYSKACSGNEDIVKHPQCSQRSSKRDAGGACLNKRSTSQAPQLNLICRVEMRNHPQALPPNTFPYFPNKNLIGLVMYCDSKFYGPEAQDIFHLKSGWR